MAIAPGQVEGIDIEASQIAAQFPRLRARLRTRKAHYGAAPDNTFQFGLDAVLDGLKTRLGAIDQ